jgi:predicted Zn-dependent peptidase
VDHDDLVVGVERALTAAGWDLSVESAPVERRSVEADLIERGSPMILVERPIEQAHVLLGVPGLVATDERRTVQTVLNSILGVGMSSRLFQEVREKRGLAYSVYSFAPSYSDAGAFGMYAGCSPSKAADVAELLLGELRRVAEHGVTDAEVQRARGALAGASALALEDSDTRMTRLGRSEITLGEFLDLDEALRRIGLVTPEEVQELAGDFVARPLSIAAVGAVDESMFAGLHIEPSAV